MYLIQEEEITINFSNSLVVEAVNAQGKVVGTLKLGVRINVPSSELTHEERTQLWLWLNLSYKTLVIDSLEVDKEYRRSGVATALFNYAIENVVDKASRVVLNAAPARSASVPEIEYRDNKESLVRFYKSVGFEMARRSVTGRGTELYLMEKKLEYK